MVIASAVQESRVPRVDVGLRPARIRELLYEWDDLFKSAELASVFQLPEWIESWWHVYGQIRRLRILEFRDEGGMLVGLAPMMLQRHRRWIGRWAVGLAGGWASGQQHLLIRPGWEPGVVRAFLERCRRESPTGLLPEMPDPWPAYFVGRQVEHGELIAGLRFHLANQSPVIGLPRTWDDYESALKAKNRHELRRKLRRAEAGGLTYRDVSGGATLRNDLNSLFALNNDRWGYHGLWANDWLAYRNKRRFLQLVAARLAPRGALHLHMAELEGRPVAGLLCFDDGKTCFAYLTGYDPRLSDLSPGLATFAHAIRCAIERGTAKFNFVCGQHDYKYRLGAHDEPLWDVEICSQARL